MDEDGRGDRPPVITVPGDGAAAGRKAVAGRLDHWWDPAWDAAWWDAAWWDPAWSADRPAGAPAPAAATGQPGGAALAADPAGPGTLASLPDASPGHMARPAAGHVAEPAVAVPAGSAVAVPAGTAAVPQPPPAAAADPSWSQVLTTTISLWMSRRRPQAGITGRPSTARVPEALVPGLRARRSRLAAWGRAVPVRLLAASMLGAGLLAVGAGTAGLLTASGSPTASVRWAARPSPLPEPSGRTVGPALLATVQQTARPVWLSVPAIGVRTRLVDLGLNRNGTLQVPASTTVAGWFTGSPRPGAVGPAVIAGHVDSRTGPAVFFWLRILHPGQRIYVGRADGTLAVFTVTSVRMYGKDEFPTAAVYGPVPDAELRLITCGGIFDASLGSYLSNVVVFARMTG